MPNVNAGKLPENPFALPTPLLAVYQNVYPYSGRRQPPPNRGPRAAPSSSRIYLNKRTTPAGICTTQPRLHRVGLTVRVRRSINQREGVCLPPFPRRLSVPNTQHPHLVMGAAWRTVPLHRYRPHLPWTVDPSRIPCQYPLHRCPNMTFLRQHDRCSKPTKQQQERHGGQCRQGLIRPN